MIEVLLPTCKKGENDPFLSLRSRKAKITGEWKLKSGNSSYTYNDTTETITYHETKVDVVYSTSDSGTIASVSISYTERWTINKDYSFKIIQNNFDYYIEYSGYWNFYYKDKELDLKNKEAIIFRVTSKKIVYTISGVNNSDYTYSGTYCPTFLFFIDKLTNKKIIVKYEGTSIWPYSSESGKATMTLNRKKGKSSKEGFF